MTGLLAAGWLAWIGAGFAARAEVKLGIDFLEANNFKGLEGQRVGLITNQTGVNAAGVSTKMVLFRAPQVKLVALYAPEHGLNGVVWAGEKVSNAKDQETGLPVYSLYGDTRKPTPEMLENIDVLIYDIQDIGCRSYTFISTMGLAMEAAAESGKTFMVLDRPNPMGGNRVEGPPLDPAYRSFVGQWDIPYIYGMTCGELAQMISDQKWIKKSPRLIIVPMQGYQRTMTWAETGLMWVPTSPWIPRAETSYFYGLTGLIGEGVYVNHGVGYTLPFETLARPDFDAFKMADALNAYGLPGIHFMPIFYQTFMGSFKDKVCQGVHIYITDPDQANLCDASMYLLEYLGKKEGARNLFSVAATKPKSLFMKVCGGDAILNHFQAGKSAKSIIASWQPSLAAFQKLRAKYLLKNYGGTSFQVTTPDETKPTAKPKATGAKVPDVPDLPPKS